MSVATEAKKYCKGFGMVRKVYQAGWVSFEIHLEAFRSKYFQILLSRIASEYLLKEMY